MDEIEQLDAEIKARSRRRLRILLFIVLLLGSQIAWMRFWPGHPLNTWNDTEPMDLERIWREQAERSKQN